MNPVELILTAQAVTSGRAQRRRQYRHVHLERAPLVIAVMQMAGEPHALWGALIGNDPRRPRLIVAPEPRNLDIEFAALADFADVICDAFDAAARRRVQIPRKKGDPIWRCERAPQVLVANRAVIDLLDRLGRRMRPAGFGGHVTVPASVNVAGAHLGFVAQSARHPGSALALVATEELARHAVTGQSALEDAHLGAQLAWWDPATVERIRPGILGGADPSTMKGAEAALRIERTPMSVLTDPRKDTLELLDMVVTFNRLRARATDRATVERLGGNLRAELEAALMPTWRALWIAHEQLAWIEPAPGADKRWEGDLTRFTRHVDYLANGGRYASVDSARRAAILLADWERAQAELECHEILEDPLAMAAAIAQGQAIRGPVIDVDTGHVELSGSGKRMVARPVLTLQLEDACPFPVGTELWWTAQPGSVKTEIVQTDASGAGSRVALKVKAGMTLALPALGDVPIFSVYTTSWVPPAGLPTETPWTHVASKGSADALELDDGPALEDALVSGGAA